MSNTSSSPLELDYTNRDYDSILSFLISAARGFMPEWVSVGDPSDFGTLLLELYAYMGDVSNYYIDRVAAEPFLASAVRRQSILGIADMLGYTPIAKQAATGVVTFTLTDPNIYTSSPLQIPEGTRVQTQSGDATSVLYFETVGVAVLGGTFPRTVDVGAQEGTTVSLENLAVSNGAPLQEYVLRYQGAIHRSLTLTVQESAAAAGLIWSYVDNLTNTSPDASVFTTYLDDRQYTHVVFGDNVAGRIPPNGAQISVSYRYGQGALGNVAMGKIIVITPPITGVAVTNNTVFQGGADDESIDSMRHSISRAARIKNRAITLADFSDLAQQVPGVAKAVATGAFYTNIKLYIAPVGGGYPSVDLLNAVQQYIQDRSLVGTTIEMHPTYLNPPTTDASDPIYTWVYVQMVVHVLPQFGQLTVLNAVIAAIVGLFSFDNPDIDFGGLMSRGDVFHTAMNVDGVDWVDLVAMYPLDDSGHQIGTAAVQDVQAGPTRILSSDNTAPHLNITATGGLT